MQVVLALLVLVQVWRVQDLLPVIAIPGLPVLCTLAVLLLLVLDRDPRRRLDSLKPQTLTACLVGFVVGAFFSSLAYAAYLYMLLGMIVGLARTATPRQRHLFGAGLELSRSALGPNP